MNHTIKRARLGTLVLAFSLVQTVSVCGQENQTLPDDWREQYAYTLGVQAYVFSFPWSYLPELRYTWVTQEPSNASTPYAPLNHFWHVWKLADADYRDGGSPNYDTLYSLAWLDVGKEPVILSHPDVKDRYFTFQIASMTSDNIDYVGSRTTGSEAGHFAITGPDWRGELPPGVKRLKPSPTAAAPLNRSDYLSLVLAARCALGSSSSFAYGVDWVGCERLAVVFISPLIYSPFACSQGPTPTVGPRLLENSYEVHPFVVGAVVHRV